MVGGNRGTGRTTAMLQGVINSDSMRCAVVAPEIHMLDWIITRFGQMLHEQETAYEIERPRRIVRIMDGSGKVVHFVGLKNQQSLTGLKLELHHDHTCFEGAR